MTDAAVLERSSPGYAGGRDQLFQVSGKVVERLCRASCRAAGRSGRRPVDDGPLLVFANSKSLTACRSVSGSTVSPVHADLIVTSWGVLGRPRPSFLADGQLSVPGMRHRCETSFVPLSPPMASLNATAMGFASVGDNARPSGYTAWKLFADVSTTYGGGSGSPSRPTAFLPISESRSPTRARTARTSASPPGAPGRQILTKDRVRRVDVEVWMS